MWMLTRETTGFLSNRLISVFQGKNLPPFVLEKIVRRVKSTYSFGSHYAGNANCL